MNMQQRAATALAFLSAVCAIVAGIGWYQFHQLERAGRVDSFYNTLEGVMEREVASGATARNIAIAAAIAAVLFFIGFLVAKPPPDTDDEA